MDIERNCNSTGKYEVQRAQPFRIKSCSKLPIDRSRTSEKKRAQPVRIAQLLLSENNKTKRKNGKSLYNYSTTYTRNVRRNLIFNFEGSKQSQSTSTEVLVNIQTNVTSEQKAGKLTDSAKCKDDQRKSSHRKSCLKPPTDIKNLNLKQQSKKKETSARNTNMWNIVETPEVSKELNKKKTTAISSALKGKQKSEDNIAKVSCSNTKPMLAENTKRENTKCNDTKTVDIIDALQKMCKDDRECNVFASFMYNTEKNISEIKSVLAHVVQLLNSNESSKGDTDCIKKSDKNVQTEQCYEEGSVSAGSDGNPENVLKKATADKEVQTEIYQDNHIQTVNVTENSSQTSAYEINTSGDQDIEDKENSDPLNLLKDIDITRTSNNSDDSFVNVERKLGIICTKSIVPNATRAQSTPTLIINKKNHQSLQEYMALKSCVSFLETPNIKRFRSFHQSSSEEVNVATRSHISTKILSELHHLYTDSPHL